MKAHVAILLMLGAALSVEAAPLRLLCKGAITMAFDAKEITDQTRIDVELDPAAGWISFKGWSVNAERIPATTAGNVMTFAHTAPGPGVVSTTKGRMDLATRRIYLDTTFSSSEGPGKRWTTDWGMQVTTLRVMGEVPC
ncbi:MAG: hypothetical protein Q8R63_05530 [Ramlibacter sp.]|nr:hypothetical protein [Ramlibacter sp.]